MNSTEKKMVENLHKTFELIELSKDLYVARIVKEMNISASEAEVLFWKEVRRIKDLNSGVTDNDIR